jgi:hypothetical protein
VKLNAINILSLDNATKIDTIIGGSSNINKVLRNTVIRVVEINVISRIDVPEKKSIILEP